ncbi:YegP family protein [Arenibacter sp. GZD96]|uniref:YegP family protein n=1 Tax=Aurantibrevibacter litoralis TaxID=3106030 RepID=UPI002AFDC9B2|nr:YegP family protein [Arenibacter sp. GZD-96]MEA1786294.1 YegP family protein [Arenibacter sp. GZD-96]
MVVLRKEGHGNYGFSIRTKTGGILFSSTTYRSEEEVNELIEKLNTSFEDSFYVDRHTDHHGQFFFTLKNNLGHIVGHGNLYDSEPGLENGIKNFKSALG